MWQGLGRRTLYFGRKDSQLQGLLFQVCRRVKNIEGTLLQDLTQDSATLTGWRRTKRSGEGKMIAPYGPGISLLRYLNFPTFFEIPEFSWDLHDQSEEFLSYAGILHSSVPEDISGIFRRFTLWKYERVHMVGSNAGSQGYYSTPLPLHHNYLTWKVTKYNKFFFIYSTSYTHNKRMSEFAIKNKQ